MNTSLFILYGKNMAEVGIAEYFSMAEALGIIATLFVILCLSRKQMQSLSVDIETKILNDMYDRMNGLTQIVIERPELIKVVNNVERDLSSEVVYSYRILYTFAHAYHMRERCSK
jgi:hypothetical protein